MTAIRSTRWSSLGLMAGLVLLATPTDVLGQPSTSGGGESILSQLERALETTIERCEGAVVSITRTSEPPSALAARNNAASRLVGQVGGANRIFFRGQQGLPGGLGGLQAIPNPPPLASGAGVVFDAEERLILTQYRVVRLGDTHLVTDVEGNRYLAKIRAADPRSGLAVLAIESRFPKPDRSRTDRSQAEPIELPSLSIGKAETLKKGRLVIAIGNPFSIESDGQPTASWGSITNTAMKAPSDENLNDARYQDGSYRTTLHHFGSLIQTDARLGWNANGGAVVNLNGELVGVTTTAAAIAGHEQPAGYAIPLNEAMRRAIEAMRQGIEPEYGLLGVRFSTGAARSQRTGAVGIAVGDAFRGGPAQRGGLKQNDLLLEIAGKPVPTPEALQLIVGSLPPGEAVPVVFERGGTRDEATVTLGKAYIGEGQIVSRSRASWRGLRVDYATAIPPQILGEKAAKGHLDPEGCVVVTNVEKGSVSYESGVRPYSFISHVSGQRVTTPKEFYSAVRDAKENVKLKFTKPLSRDNKPVN